jgi:hypothetical protein
MEQIDYEIFLALKEWASNVSYQILSNSDFLPTTYVNGYDAKKVQSIILESMSPSKGWKNSK